MCGLFIQLFTHPHTTAASIKVAIGHLVKNASEALMLQITCDGSSALQYCASFGKLALLALLSVHARVIQVRQLCEQAAVHNQNPQTPQMGDCQPVGVRSWALLSPFKGVQQGGPKFCPHAYRFVSLNFFSSQSASKLPTSSAAARCR